ncbi:MAG: regulatory protein RecX [Bdellovibrionota bacterium]|nr:regulatory protein RecX [Bdellovibrionota bacterium]
MKKARYPKPNKSAFDKCIDFLAQRDHSELELREKLFDRSFTEEEIDLAIAELHERSYLLEPEALAQKVASAQARRGKGNRFIQNYLQKKGLPEHHIELNVEVEQAFDLIKRKEKCEPPFSYDMKVKIQGFLANRGYSYEVIQKVVHHNDQSFVGF